MSKPHQIKAYAPFELKDANEEARSFEGHASTWDLDLDGDEIQKGAFKRSVDRLDIDPKYMVPLIDQHNYKTVRSVFGKLVAAEERDEGLWTKFSVVASPEGDEYLARIKGGYLNGLSIGFEVTKADAPVEKQVGGKRQKVRVIKEVYLREISAVIWGANPNAVIDTMAAKALIHEARLRPLTDDERDEFKALHTEMGALLAESEPGLAPDDPHRIELEAMVRGLRVRHLEAFAH